MDYDTALKKLINILKFKHTDGLKQIEDLWDTINTTATTIQLKNNNNYNNKNDDQNIQKVNSKRTASELQTFNKKPKLNHQTVNNNNNNNNKLINKKINNSSDSLTSLNGNSNDSNDIIKCFNDSTDESFKQQNKNLSVDNVSNNDDSVEMKVVEDYDDKSNISNGSNISSNGSNSNSHNNNNNNNNDVNNKLDINTSKIDDYAVDMGLTCDICLSLTQEQNNKLAECQECKRLYHQLCHKPMITNEEIQDPRKLWYCAKCIKNLKKFANGNSLNKNQLNKNEKLVNNNNNNNHVTLTSTQLIVNKNDIQHVNSNHLNEDNNNKLYKKQISNENNVNNHNNINNSVNFISHLNGNNNNNNNNNNNSSSSSSNNGSNHNNHNIKDEYSNLENSQSIINNCNNGHNKTNSSNDQKLFFKRDPKTLITNEKPVVENTNKTGKGLAALASKLNTTTTTTSTNGIDSNLNSNINNNKSTLTSTNNIQQNPFSKDKFKSSSINGSTSPFSSLKKIGLNETKPLVSTLKTNTTLKNS